jgi:DNA-binding response OmpR family regulator
VDDSQEIRDLYALALRFAGFEVLEARDGFDALRLLDDKRPDVIVLDLMMPRLNGWETSRRIRAHRGAAGVPIIALTSLDDQWDLAAEYGWTEVCTKPTKVESLIAAIGRVLAQS